MDKKILIISLSLLLIFAVTLVYSSVLAEESNPQNQPFSYEAENRVEERGPGLYCNICADGPRLLQQREQKQEERELRHEKRQSENGEQIQRQQRNRHQKRAFE